LCDNGNTNPAITETMWGQAPGGCFGYSHAMGGNAGSHAQYIRVPFADVGAFTVPDAVSDETLNYGTTSVKQELRERSGGRGPDVCIEAVGMEAHGTGTQFGYDMVKQQLRLQTDRPIAVRDAIHACRKGGSVFLATHVMPLDRAPEGYRIFRDKEDNCVRAVFLPN
jgi:threonine dehydrogenase-like Zn-dependent dehydrogenase